MAIIKENTSVSMNDLAKQIGISLKGIEWQIKRLKQEDILKHIGPDKVGGH